MSWLTRTAHAVVRPLGRPFARQLRLLFRSELQQSQNEMARHISVLERRIEDLVRLTTHGQATQEERLTMMGQRLRYLALAAMTERIPTDLGLTRAELSFSSQNGEDGVLAEIFHHVGAANRCFVEIGCQASESNCVFLADVLGWSGVVIEGDPANAEALRRKYGPAGRVKVLQVTADRDNLDRLLRESSVPVDVDVLSIDIDGNDYWLWERLTGYRPRVVVIEYNSALKAEDRVVQPYDPVRSWDGTSYFGASGRALIDLGLTKGYQAVHADLASCNLFFVRHDVVTSGLPRLVEARRPANYKLEAYHHRDPPPGARWVHLDESAPSGPGPSPPAD